MPKAFILLVPVVWRNGIENVVQWDDITTHADDAGSFENVTVRDVAVSTFAQRRLLTDALDVVEWKVAWNVSKKRFPRRWHSADVAELFAHDVGLK